MSTGNSIFAGNSRYASDFQAVIDRSVAIASLPLSQLNKQKAALNERSAALTALDLKFTAVDTAVAAVESALGSGSWEAVLSGPDTVAATVGTSAMEGSYAIEVTSLGAYSTAIGKDEGLPRVTNPDRESVSAAAAFTMKVNGVAWSLRPAARTLTSLAESVNASGAAVRATVVNVGSPSAPDWRLALESTKLGPVTLELSDGASDLLATQVTGSLARYRVNGVAQEAGSDSRTVALAPGLTVQLEAQSPAGVATGITVTRQSSALASALGSLAAAYNAAMDELDRHRGESRGALAGQQAVYALGQSLREMANYSSGGGAVSSLADLGFTFDKTGRLSFQSMTFMAADLEGGGQVAAFFGSTLGGGFLKAARASLDAASHPAWGRVRTEMAAVTADIRRTDARIAGNQERVDRLKVTLQERMAAADALIASLEQNYRYLSGVLEAMRSAAESFR